MQAKTKSQIAAEYHISTRTLKKWLIPILPRLGITPRQYDRLRLFTPRQVQIIYDHLGSP